MSEQQHPKERRTRGYSLTEGHGQVTVSERYAGNDNTLPQRPSVPTR